VRCNVGCPAPRNHSSLRRVFGHRNSRGFTRCSLALCAMFAISSVPLLGQPLSAEKQILLKRKGELLKEIQGYEQKKAAAQATLSQAISIRDMAKAANHVNDANVAAEAVGVSRQAIATAEKDIADDQQRLDAINRALNWPASAQPRAVATLARGHIVLETPNGPRPFDPTAPVEIGEQISVGDDGFLELQLDDGSQMQLGPKTDFEYQRDVQGVYYQLFQGELHKITIMGVRGANDQARYRGLQSISAVRGTEFTLEIIGGQDVYTVFEGWIEVDPTAGRAKIAVKAGQRLTVSKSGAVGQPVAFDPKTVQHWWEQ
jgi:hypothetical protein